MLRIPKIYEKNILYINAPSGERLRKGVKSPKGFDSLLALPSSIIHSPCYRAD